MIDFFQGDVDLIHPRIYQLTSEALVSLAFIMIMGTSIFQDNKKTPEKCYQQLTNITYRATPVDDVHY